MKKVELELKEVEVLSVDKITKQVNLAIKYFSNSEYKTLNYAIKFGDVEEISEEIMKTIRTREKTVDIGFGDDILSGFTIVSFKDEDRSQEKLMQFLNKFKEKLRGFERNKSADNYLDKFHEMKNQKMSF
ncbi:MAG: hypothetical protein PHE43_00105 [Candidatus Nanoarchaeia archaeon]|nr:hypothetical protein [Candidatus Nanoarchaeia archaeon]